MHGFIYPSKLYKLNQEEIRNLNRPITKKLTETMIENKKQWFAEFCHTFKEELLKNPSYTLQNNMNKQIENLKNETETEGSILNSFYE